MSPGTSYRKRNINMSFYHKNLIPFDVYGFFNIKLLGRVVGRECSMPYGGSLN